MTVDWTKYPPSNDLDQVEIDIICEVAQSYLASGQGLSHHAKKIALGRSWRKLSDVINRQFYVRQISDKLYPGFQSLCFAPTFRARAEAVVDVTLKALKFLHARTQPSSGPYGCPQIADAVRAAKLGEWPLEVVQQAAVFLADFQIRFGFTLRYGTSIPVEIVYLHGDEIIDYESLEEAWAQIRAERLRSVPVPAVRPNNAVAAGVTAELQDFAFIANDDLRRIIRRDYAELQNLKDGEGLKSRIVLAGGLIEAVLLDALCQNEMKARATSAAQKDQLEKWDLANLIKAAVELRLLTQDAKQYGEFARMYRNLVHPGLELRSGQTVRVEIANIAKHVLEMVITDVQTATQKPGR